MKTNRREFIRKAGIATACVCTGLAGVNGCSMIGGISRTPEIMSDSWELDGDSLIVNLDRIDCLRDTGGSGKLNIGGQLNGDEIKIIIIHQREEEYKAFADCCTHGCRELNYLHEKEQLECSSFGKSAFTLSGKVIKGPAETPLKTYSLQKTDNRIIIDIA